MSGARRQAKGEQVRRELLPEQSPQLLRELHLLTREGNLNADALRKLKQVNDLVGLLRPAMDDILARHPSPVVVDAGSGNAYLGFILYEVFLKDAEAGTLLNIEGRPELTQRAKERAGRLGFTRMEFQTAHLETAQWPERVHLLTALHACDTATDDALAVAIQKGADHVAVVPCCQAEVAAQLKESRQAVDPTLVLLYQHPWHRREFGSHLTNVVRGLALEAHGYKITVTELVGWEHSAKNELILGKRVHRYSTSARAQLRALLERFEIEPAIVRSLAARGLDPRHTSDGTGPDPSDSRP